MLIASSSSLHSAQMGENYLEAKQQPSDCEAGRGDCRNSNADVASCVAITLCVSIRQSYGYRPGHHCLSCSGDFYSQRQPISYLNIL
jgi:hypothetical protein